MKIRHILRWASLVFALAFLAGCGNPFDAALTARDPDKGLVSLHIADGNAGTRTLLPAAPVFSRYDLRFSGEGKEAVILSSAGSAIAVELAGGSWTVTVEAYVTIQGEDYLAARGEAAVDVIPGQPANVSVSIRANNTGEAGIFSYDIRLLLDAGSLSKALLVFESLDSNSHDNREIDLQAEGAETGTFSVTPGFYLVKVRLENGYQAAGKTEVVHIYTGMETRAEYVFRADDLTRTVPIKGALPAATYAAGHKRIELFVYGDAVREDLIVSTGVDLSDGAWETAIPFGAYGTIYFTLHIEDATGVSFSASAGSAAIPDTGISGMVIIPEPKMISFSMPAAETGLDADITGVIDEEQQTILLATQKWIEHINNLKAAFVATGIVTVGGTEQESGVTEQDFRSDIVYRVTTGDSATRDYRVVFESPQTTGLPVMKIDTKGRQSITSKETYVYTNIKIVDPNNAIYNVEHTGYEDRIRGRGNATWGYPKKPYKIKLNKSTDMLGMGKDKDWVLLANYCDKTLLRTAIAFKLSELLDFPWTPKARFVELFLNGEYMGNYQLVEGIKQGDNRVDIPKAGYIIEMDGYYLYEPKYFVTNDGYGYSFKNPDTDDLTDDQWNYIRDYMNEFESVLGSGSFDDPVSGYSKYIDIESFARWFLFQNILANMDTNPFLIKEDDTYNTKLLMGPVWDFEWSIGIGWYDGARPRPADYWVQDGWYFDKLLTDDVFVEKLQEFWSQNGTLVRQEILQFFDDTQDEITKSQVMNFRRWDIMNAQISVGGIPLGSFDAEVACDRQFFINHMEWLDTAIDGL